MRKDIQGQYRTVSTAGEAVRTFVPAPRTALAPATVNRALARLEDLGLVRERTGQQRNRVFSYAAYLEILDQGTELPG
jgi:DNA-binding transcriptional ArsR family regulator